MALYEVKNARGRAPVKKVKLYGNGKGDEEMKDQRRWKR